MRPVRAALVTGLVVSAPVLLWAAGRVALDGGTAPPPRLAAAVAALWLAQALCVVVLLPACVTLWTTREAAAAASVFVLFPLPLLVLAWQTGALPAMTGLRGVAGLAIAASAVLAAAPAVRGLARRAHPVAGVGVLLQVGLGSVVVVYRESWMSWVGL